MTGYPTHGMSYSKEYRAWQGAHDRCSNSANKNFLKYGARGIIVCERWTSFENFFADMGRKPSKTHSLDRIDNNGNYEPGNCRWATIEEQSNNKSYNRHVTINGERLTVAQASRITGINRTTIQDRINLGQSDKNIIRPVRKKPKPVAASIGGTV